MKYFKTLFIITCLASIVFYSPASLAQTRVNNFRVTKTTEKIITLKWKANSRAIKYQIRVIKEGELIRKVYTTKNTKKIKKLQPDTLYKFKIRAKFKKRYNKQYRTIRARTENEESELNSEVLEEEEEEEILEQLEEETVISPDPEPTPEPEPEPIPTPEPVEEEEERLEIPYGFWGLNGYTDSDGLAEVQDNFGVNVYQVLSDGPNYNLNTLLPRVEASGMKINLNITGNYYDFRDGDGNFDINLWKQSLDDYFSDPDTAAETQVYIDNGTIVGIMILDDIYNYSYSYGGVNPTSAELEEMACNLKEYVDVTTWIREDISYLDPYEFNCLDAAGLQYSAVKGSVEDYIVTQGQAASDLNLDIVAGLNICDGGDGSSGQQGWRSGRYAMSAEEITTYGEAMLGIDNVIMFLMWEYDGEELWADGETIGADYFDQSELQEAIYNLGQ